MKNHLPLLGAGPAYAGTIALATAVALILDHQNMIKPGNAPDLCAFFYFTGGVFMASGIFFVGHGKLPVQDQREYSEKRPGDNRNLWICEKSHPQRPSAGEHGPSSFSPAICFF